MSKKKKHKKKDQIEKPNKIMKVLVVSLFVVLILALFFTEKIDLSIALPSIFAVTVASIYS